MPRVLLLDEPLSNLDARLRLQTREEIRRIQRETNITTVFVTHDQEEAMSISDIIVVMKLGVVQQIGKPQDVYDSPANLFVAKFLGTPPINVFEGEVKDGKVYIGDDAVLDVPRSRRRRRLYRHPSRRLYSQRKRRARLQAQKRRSYGTRRQHSDPKTLTANQPAYPSTIDATTVVDTSKDEVRFDIKPNKIFIFSRKRIDWSMANEPATTFEWGKIRQTLSVDSDGKTVDFGTLKTREIAQKETNKAEKKAKQPKFVKKIVKTLQNKFDSVIRLCTPKAKPVELAV